MNVASRIIYLREQKGLTTNKLANMAGISQSHLREIELGPWRNSSGREIRRSTRIL